MVKPSLTVPLEIKALSEREFEGHGAVFNNVDMGGDIVVPGAFTKSLAAHRQANSLPLMLWMHDPSRVPGKWIDMREDSKGLAVKGVLADTELGNEIHTLLKMEAVKGLSIGFRLNERAYDKNGNRLIKEADVREVSVVPMPMNPLAEVVYVKSRLSADGAYVPTEREIEELFRDQGCSKQTARKLTRKIFDSAGGTLAEDEDEPLGGTLDGTAEAGETLVEPDEEAQAIAACKAIAESIYADKISRAAARGFR